MRHPAGDGYPYEVAVAFHLALVMPTGLSVMTWNSELIDHLAGASTEQAGLVLGFYALAVITPLIIAGMPPTTAWRTISVLTQIVFGTLGLMILNSALNTSAELGRTIMRIPEANPLQLIVLALIGIGAFRSATLLTRHTQTTTEQAHSERQTDATRDPHPRQTTDDRPQVPEVGRGRHRRQ